MTNILPHLLVLLMMLNVICECVVLGSNPGPCACRASVLPLTYTCVDHSKHLCDSHTLPDLALISPDQQTLFSHTTRTCSWLGQFQPVGLSKERVLVSVCCTGWMVCSQRWGSAFYSSLALAPCLPSTDALEIFAKLEANIRNVYTVLNAQDLAWHLKPLL